MYQKMFDAVAAHRDLILEAEDRIRRNPELGFREWKTHAYLKERFEELGYTLTEAGNIPGFYTDVETGVPGPKIAVFGELDALPAPGHPFADPETGAAHACGHNCQCAALLGLAAALKTPGVLEGLSGSVRLIAVPAEEGISSEYRKELKDKKTVRYFSGKPEFLYRGYLDGVDMAMMIHTDSEVRGMSCPEGSNGNVRKKATFIGKACHASTPQNGLNALYAATTALSAANALRETFREEDHIRMHPILTKGGNVVNSIPDEVICENMIRGADYRVIAQVSEKVNRAFAASAAALGCKVRFDDLCGSAPRHNDENLREAFHQVAGCFFPEEDMNFHDKWGVACSDMGDISSVIPSVHPFIGGATGEGHSANYLISDPELACVTAAKILAGVTEYLLRDGAANARRVIAEKKVPFASKEEFFRLKDSLTFSGEGVEYKDDGTVLLKFKA